MKPETYTKIVLKYVNAENSANRYVGLDRKYYPSRTNVNYAHGFLSYESADAWRKQRDEEDNYLICELVITVEEKNITKPKPSIIGTEVLTKWKVWEIERDSWSGAEYDTRYFNSEHEARQFVIETNGKNVLATAPEFYVTAEYVGKVEVIAVGNKFRELK